MSEPSTDDLAGVAVALTNDLALHLLHQHREVALSALSAATAIVAPALGVPLSLFADRLKTADLRLLGHLSMPRVDAITREDAITIARACAKAKPQSYYAEPFEPHEWVIDAIVAAAGTAAEPVRAACIHCKQDVADIADVEAIRAHSMSCEKSPVVQEQRRLRTIVEQAEIVARHWDAQDGINGSELDRLVALVFDRSGCPNCGAELQQETVDVGVGNMPIGPVGCAECHWFEGQPLLTRVALLARVHNLEVELAQLRERPGSGCTDRECHGECGNHDDPSREE